MSRSRFATLAVVTAVFAADVSAQQQQVDNVAAFARLYGVARWFYPSDAAASLDWNRFAAEGARRVRDHDTTAITTQPRSRHNRDHGITAITTQLRSRHNCDHDAEAVTSSRGTR